MKNMHSSLTQKTNADAAGQAMVEFALVIPVLVLLLLGTIDLARAVYAFGVISNAARDGAHWASLRPTLPLALSTNDTVHGDLDTAAVKAKAKANAKTLEIDDRDVSVQCQALGPDENPYMQGLDPDVHKCDSWNQVIVEIKYEFHPITLFFGQIPIVLKSTSTMTIE